MEFFKLFLLTFIMPLLPIVLCGLAVYGFERMFMALTGNFGRGFYIATSIIGTPMHEIGHAVMCLPFGHKINKICLWNPKAPKGVMGFVDHSYNKKNIWHSLGNIFISTGPVIMGLLAVTLMMLMGFPDTLENYYSASMFVEPSVGGLFEMLGECIKMIPAAFTDNSSHVALKVISGVVIVCVCMHISLSPADIKNSVRGLWAYALICLAIAGIMYFAYDGFGDKLVSFSFYVFSLFMVVFAGIIFLMGLAIIFWIIGKIFKRA